jgi:hypothetical protein
MNEINKDELLDLTKWQRFFFMVIYSFAINGVVGILIIIACRFNFSSIYLLLKSITSFRLLTIGFMVFLATL